MTANLNWTHEPHTDCYKAEGLAVRYLIRPFGGHWQCISFSIAYPDSTPLVVIQGVSLAEAKATVEEWEN